MRAFFWSALELVTGIGVLSACILLIVGVVKVIYSIVLLVLGDAEKAVGRD